MTKQEMESILAKQIDKKSVLVLAEQVAKIQFSIKDLINLSLHKTPEIAFRSAWILENTINYSRELFITYIPDFIDTYIKLQNESCKRHFTKILIFLFKNRLILLEGEKLDAIIDTTFEWLVITDTPVAVKVNCLDILFYCKDKSDWIREELPSQIEFLLKDGSAAMQSRGKKLLKKLK